MFYGHTGMLNKHCKSLITVKPYNPKPMDK